MPNQSHFLFLLEAFPTQDILGICGSHISVDFNYFIKTTLRLMESAAVKANIQIYQQLKHTTLTNKVDIENVT